MVFILLEYLFDIYTRIHSHTGNGVHHPWISLWHLYKNMQPYWQWRSSSTNISAAFIIEHTTILSMVFILHEYLRSIYNRTYNHTGNGDHPPWISPWHLHKNTQPYWQWCSSSMDISLTFTQEHTAILAMVFILHGYLCGIYTRTRNHTGNGVHPPRISSQHL